MKNGKFIIATTLVALALGACNKNTEPEVTAPETYTFTVIASKADGLTKALSMSGTTITAEWKENDVVSVYNDDESSKIGELIATSDGASTTLEGSLTTALSEGDELVLTYGRNDYSSQKGTSVEYIGENFDYGKATVEVTEVDTENKTITTTEASFVSQQTIVKFTLKDSEGTALTGITELKVYDGTNLISVIPAAATDEPLYVALPGISARDIILSAVAGDKVYFKTVSSVTLANGKYYARSVKMAENALAMATIGQVITTDGSIYDTVSEATSAGKEAIAIIAYVGENTGDKLFNHGLAIALADVSDDNYVWDSDSDYESHECFVSSKATLHYDSAIKDYNGITNTATLVSDGHGHDAAKKAADYSASRPAQASAWHLPSIGEWNMIVLGLTGQATNMPLITKEEGVGKDEYKATNVNTKITTAEGTGLKTGYYWSSTEFNNISAWRVDFTNGAVSWYGKHGLDETDDKVYVRDALAF